ncbi:hypothetical protein TeGR_g13395 [Tetraparma gracilis]|uniref:Uncharacterized protein n=1 Tax=Tetraparma gracilis TaxID=2962635 RepID=A0ABQ6N1L7_9STRA|nr:hypothetical protein TeGR_g13395 [Tetraparma gracilis]
MAFATLGLLTGKAKFLLTGLKLFKFTPVLSMLGTTVTYSLFFGPAYSAGMVGLIAVHEAGHAIALKHYGVPFSPFVMIPFMGASIAAGPCKNAHQDAVIAMAGPVTGTLGAIACTAGAASLDSQLLYALADFGYMINLFNLLPIGSMDGGRIAGAIHPGIGALGVAGGAGLAYTGAIGNPIFYLILAGGAWSTGQRLFGYDTNPPGYYDIGASKKVLHSTAYVGMIGSLLALMALNKKKKKSPKQLGYAGTDYGDVVASALDDGDGDDTVFTN